MPARAYYGDVLSYIHDTGYSDFARAATPGLLSLLRRAGIRAGTIVEFGCGSGAATRALVAAGHDVLALDASAAMLRLARRRTPRARFVRGRLPSVTLPPCDAVVAVGEVVNYMAGRDAYARLFRRVARALRPGGLFVFDVREPGGGGGAHGRAGPDWAVLAISTEDRARATLTRTITSFRRVGRGYRRADETHRLTLVAAAELARRLRRLGFTARVAHGYGRTPLPKGCAVVVARKRP